MADLAITNTAVVPAAGSQFVTYIAGVAITAGQPVYLDPVDNTVKLPTANNATAAARSPLGWAVNGASIGQPVSIQRDGDITMNAVLTRGVTYYLSRTAGRVAPFADLTTGDFPTILGVARSTTVLNVVIREAGSAI
jgi:hypothetical protein